MTQKREVTAMSIKMVAKITSYENEELHGFLEGVYLEEPMAFSGVVDMIEMMETIYDALGFPHKSHLPRTFGKKTQRIRQNERDLAKILKARRAGKTLNIPSVDIGCLATFEIFVNFRHNAEWQGKLHWAERDVTNEFSSIVNLVKLMDEALK